MPKIKSLTFKQVKAMHEYYLLGASLAKTGEKFGVCRKSLHGYFKRLNLPTRAKKKNKAIFYNNKKYTEDSYGIYRETTGHRKYLHIQVWIDNGFIIPHRHYLIHVDGNKANNSVKNLKLVDWVTFRKHYQHKGNNQFTPFNKLRHKSKSRYKIGD
jgi:predicted DNA-binding protein YlxM (UPF0122 family)